MILGIWLRIVFYPTIADRTRTIYNISPQVRFRLLYRFSELNKTNLKEVNVTSAESESGQGYIKKWTVVRLISHFFRPYNETFRINKHAI